MNQIEESIIQYEVTGLHKKSVWNIPLVNIKQRFKNRRDDDQLKSK